MTDSHLDDDALSAAVDGAAAAAELAHLSSCSRCQARLEEFTAVAHAVRAPVPPRAATDVSMAIDMAIDQAVASWGRASSAAEPGGRVADRAAADRAAPSTHHRPDRPADQVAPGPTGRPAGPRPKVVGRLSGRGAHRGPAMAKWAGAAAAAAAAVAVVAGLVSMSRGNNAPAVNASRALAPTTTAGAPGARAGVNGLSNVDGGDLGDQSDPAVVARDLTSRLSRSAAAAQGGNLAAASTIAPRAPSPSFGEPVPPCPSQGQVAAGLPPGPAVVPRLVATLRWRGEAAAVLVYATSAGQTGVIMRSADCALLAVIQL